MIVIQIATHYGQATCDHSSKSTSLPAKIHVCPAAPSERHWKCVPLDLPVEWAQGRLKRPELCMVLVGRLHLATNVLLTKKSHCPSGHATRLMQLVDIRSSWKSLSTRFATALVGAYSQGTSTRSAEVLAEDLSSFGGGFSSSLNRLELLFRPTSYSTAMAYFSLAP
jgi:hypothetical protein